MRRALFTFVAALLALSTLGLLAPIAPVAAAPMPAATTAASVDPGVRDSVVRLYQATFDRAPEAEGLDYWLTFYVRGMPLTTIAEHFMTSPEWQARVGSPDDARFVDLLYRNVLGRAADESGSAYWQDQLRRGYPRAALVVSFSESSELVQRTGTAAPVPPPPLPWPAVPANSGQGFRIVYGNSAQRVWMVDEHGLVHDSYLVSGRPGTPAPGRYKVFSKSEKAWAGHHGITMNWMVRFAWGETLALGFHSIPRYADGRPLQSEAELGSYRSAGCVRQSDHKAEALYRWTPVGTTVVVLA